MPSKLVLGDLDGGIVPLEEISERKAEEESLFGKQLTAAIYLAKLVIWASIGLIVIWMLMVCLHLFTGLNIDTAMKIPSVFIPFWSTITGAVLGYLFGKKEETNST